MNIGNDDKAAKEIINIALARLGIRSDSKEAIDFRVITAGLDYKDDSHELIARSFERNYLGIGSDINKEIEKIVIERLEKS